MLDKSIKMNMKICENHAFKYFGCIVVAFLLIDIFTIPALIAAVVYAVFAYRELFDRSLFGEEAYTYMMVPMSMRDVILGKVIAACLYLMISFVFIWVAITVASLLTGTLDFGDTGTFMMQAGAGVYDAVEDGKIVEGEIIYDRQKLLGIAVSIVTIPIKFLSFCIMFCGVFQMGAIVRHLLDPQRSSSITTVGVVFGSTVATLIVLMVMAVVIYLTSGDAETIFRSAVLMIVPATCGVGLLSGCIRIMEKKYNLC